MKFAKYAVAMLFLGLALTVSADEKVITHEELTKAVAEKKVVVLDCNGTDSYKNGHIPGAIDFKATTDLSAKLPADKNVLVVSYCGSEKCGAYKAGIEAAQKLGYTNTARYAPGISGWVASKGEVQKAQ